MWNVKLVFFTGEEVKGFFGLRLNGLRRIIVKKWLRMLGCTLIVMVMVR
jgi:hypothetical protein